MSKAGTWKQGQSGNPNGRPPKNRAFTEILAKAGCKTLDVDGKRMSGKRLTASLMWQVATLGRCTFPDGRVMDASPRDWIDIVKWLYAQIDGPPKAEMDITTAGEQITITAIEAVKPESAECGE